MGFLAIISYSNQFYEYWNGNWFLGWFQGDLILNFIISRGLWANVEGSEVILQRIWSNSYNEWSYGSYGAAISGKHLSFWLIFFPTGDSLPEKVPWAYDMIYRYIKYYLNRMSQIMWKSQEINRNTNNYWFYINSFMRHDHSPLMHMQIKNILENSMESNSDIPWY